VQAKGEEFADKFKEWAKLKERVAQRLGVSSPIQRIN
jgi:hypothetical protein